VACSRGHPIGGTSFLLTQEESRKLADGLLRKRAPRKGEEKSILTETSLKGETWRKAEGRAERAGERCINLWKKETWGEETEFRA